MMKYFAILSACHGIDSVADEYAMTRLGKLLRFCFPDSRVHRVRGTYDGKPEHSYLVRLSDGVSTRHTEYDLIDAFAAKFQQESWLEGYDDNCCYLNYPGETKVDAIGYWTAVGAPEGDYTEFDGKFYACVPFDKVAQG